MATFASPSHYCRPSNPFALVAVAYGAWRQRQKLRRLDFAALEDMGISPRAALSEARKPIWSVPPTKAR